MSSPSRRTWRANFTSRDRRLDTRQVLGGCTGVEKCPPPPSQKKAYGPIAYNSSQDWPWSVSQAFSLGIQVRKAFLSPLIQRAVSPIKKIEQIYIWDAMTTDYLFFSPSEWNFCRWRSDVLPGETFLSASGVERLLLSQTNRELWSKALFFKKPQTPVLKP